MPRQIWFGMMVGAAFGVLAAAVALMVAAGGHGSYAPAVLLFPLPMLLTRFTDEISHGLVVLALLQFPLYGALVARPDRLNRSRATVSLLIVHAALAGAAYFALRGGDFL